MILLITYYKYNLRKKVIVFFLNLLRIKENFLYMPIVNVPVFKKSAPRKNQTVNFLKTLKNKLRLV